MTEEDLYEMKLHQWEQTPHYDILRVVGGWIYTFQEKLHVHGGPDQWGMTSVFVPEKEYHGRMDV
jgi:hypothetical protein